MMRHLLRAELGKQWHRPRTYFLLGLMMLVPLVAAIAIKLNPPTLGGREDAFSFFTTGTGLLLPVAVLRFLAKFLLVVVVVLVAGDAVASEASWGNLRSVLTRPVGRGRLLVAKAGSSARSPSRNAAASSSPSWAPLLHSQARSDEPRPPK